MRLPRIHPRNRYASLLLLLSLGTTAVATASSDLLPAGPGRSEPLEGPKSVIAARAGAVAVYDPVAERMVMFGGRNGTLAFSDTWSLSLGSGTPTWTVLSPSGTPPQFRVFEAAVYVPGVSGRADRMYVIGGTTVGSNTGESEVAYLEFNRTTGSSSWNSPAVGGSFFPPRFKHSAIYDPIGDRIIVFGGTYNQSINSNYADTWELKLSGPAPQGPYPKWNALTTNPASTPITARYGHSAVYDAARQRMVVVGGYPEVHNPGWGTHVWTLSLPASGTPTWLFEIINSPPLPRSQMAAIYDAGQDRVVFFGGAEEDYDANGMRRPICNYDGRTWSLFFGVGIEPPWDMGWGYYFPTNQPQLRWGHVAVYDPQPPNNRMIMFGGVTGGLECNGGYTNETYQLTLERYLALASWTQLSSSGAGKITRGELDLENRIQATPNPSRGPIQLKLRLVRPERVSVALYDVRGRLVRDFPSRYVSGNESSIMWDGRNKDGSRVSAGLYYFLVRAETFNEKKTVMVVR